MNDHEIKLTPKEEQIVSLLVRVAEENGVVLRAAGGWCRDKLLGKQSHDLDIAIDKMTGEDFARLLEPHVGERAAIVQANPEQSKHLATAIIRIEGQSIDLVNLRDEFFGGAYDRSRILSANRFAPAEIDAERRDLTINALFWNLHTREVEDYVGGLKDLFHPLGIRLNTPLPAKRTFLDDPLRLVRALRFLARFPDAYLSSDVIAALHDKEVHEALATQVSAERIAAELLGCKEIDHEGNEGYKKGLLNYPNFAEAIYYLEHSGLLSVVLPVPDRFDVFTRDQKSRWHKYDVFAHTLILMEKLSQHPYFETLSEERQAWLLFAALNHDQGKRDPKTTQVKEDGNCSYHGHEDSSAEVVKTISERLKLSNEATDYVVKVVAAHMEPHSREWGGKSCMRRFIARYPDFWRDIIVHAECDSLASGFDRSEEEMAHYKQALETGESVLNEVKVEPPLDGRVIIGLYPELSAGPWIRDLVKHLTELRFDDPELTEDDYVAEVKRKREEVLANPAYAKFHRMDA